MARPPCVKTEFLKSFQDLGTSVNTNDVGWYAAIPNSLLDPANPNAAGKTIISNNPEALMAIVKPLIAASLQRSGQRMINETCYYSYYSPDYNANMHYDCPFSYDYGDLRTGGHTVWTVFRLQQPITQNCVSPNHYLVNGNCVNIANATNNFILDVCKSGFTQQKTARIPWLKPWGEKREFGLLLRYVKQSCILLAG